MTGKINTVTKNRTLGATDSRLLTTLSERGQTIFTPAMAAAILKQSPASIRKRLHYLARRRWLLRLERGKYLIVPFSAGPEAEYTENELVIASHLLTPYYISYRTALSFYGYTEQPGRTIYIATQNRKSPLTFNGLTYYFIKLSPHKFFGHRRIWIGEHAIMMANKEKTVVDGLDHPEHAGGIVEVGKALWRGQDDIDLERVAAYSLQMQNRAIIKRLGFLLERFELGTPELLTSLHRQLSAGYALLDTILPNSGRYDARWRVRVNLSDDELLNWRET